MKKATKHERGGRAADGNAVFEDGADGVMSGKRSKGHRNEIAIGVAVILGVAVLFFGVRFLEDRPLLGGAYELVVDFEQANGLLKGDPVTISGVEVGTVGDVRLRPRGQGVRVLLQIHDGVEIPEGSTAAIDGMAALDNVKVAIQAGPPEGALLTEGATLPAQPIVPLDQRVDSTLAGAQGTFDQAESLLASTESDLGIVLANMRAASGEAASILHQERGRLHNTLVSLETTAAQLDRMADQLDHVAREGGDSLVVAMARLNAMMRRLDGVVASAERSSTDLETLIASINDGNGTLGRFAHDPSLYNRLDSAAMRLDLILADFQRDPSRYLRELTLVEVF